MPDPTPLFFWLEPEETISHEGTGIALSLTDRADALRYDVDGVFHLGQEPLSLSRLDSFRSVRVCQHALDVAYGFINIACSSQKALSEEELLDEVRLIRVTGEAWNS